MLVLPGGVDPHVHLTPTRTATTLKGADDYTSGSLAALAGGKTTISNFINQVADTDLRTTLTEAADLVKKQAIAIDVIVERTWMACLRDGLHRVVEAETQEFLAERADRSRNLSLLPTNLVLATQIEPSLTLPFYPLLTNLSRSSYTRTVA